MIFQHRKTIHKQISELPKILPIREYSQKEEIVIESSSPKSAEKEDELNTEENFKNRYIWVEFDETSQGTA